MGTIKITVESSAAATSSWIRHIRKQQLPFATAVALTKSGNHVARESGAAIGDHFTVRKKMLRRSLVSTRANKKDWPKVQAIVHLKEWAEFMADHVTGETRRPQGGASRMAVPTSLVKRTRSGKVYKTHSPRHLRDKKGTTVTGINGTTVIKIRRGPRAKKRAGIFWTLHSRVKIKADWPVEDDASKSFSRHYRREFQVALDAAVRSARAQPGKFTSAAGRAKWNQALAKNRSR